jgi:lipopolysaccharide biosynthesis regulator YciM
MFQRLTERPGRRTAALRYLLRIYEQQSDWAQAVAIFRRLQPLTSPEHPTAIAHYLCELAEQARSRGDLETALKLLHEVRGEQRNFARSALIRAEVALDAGDSALAGRLCQRVVELHPQLLPLVLQRFAPRVSSEGGASLLQSVRPLVRADPGVRAMYAYSGLTAGVEQDEFVLQCLQDFVREDPSLNDIVRALAGDVSELTSDQGRRLAQSLSRILKRGQRYRCVECGLATATHFWQCPGCRSWDVLAPLVRVELAPVARKTVQSQS